MIDLNLLNACLPHINVFTNVRSCMRFEQISMMRKRGLTSFTKRSFKYINMLNMKFFYGFKIGLLPAHLQKSIAGKSIMVRE